jgi:septum site-determining protein MinC
MLPASAAISSDRTSASTSTSATARPVAFELKGTMAPLTVLRLRSTDLALIERQVRVKIAQLPQLFLDAPVLLDLSALDDEAAALPIAELVAALRSCKLVPVAVAHATDAVRARAVEAGLGVLDPPAAPRARPAVPVPDAPVAAALPAVPAAHAGPVVVRQPVRSGQVVYAQNNDLVVLAPVNPGAQVIADGHVHIYATLRGRAVAGAQGLTTARIFCQKLEAELVAVCGAYVMADEIPPERRGKSAQIHLDGGECRIVAL